MECLACIDIKSNHTTSKPTYVFLIISYHIISFHFSPLTNKQTDQPGPALGAHARHTLYSSGIYTYIHTCTWTCARATANQQRVPRGGGGGLGLGTQSDSVSWIGMCVGRLRYCSSETHSIDSWMELWFLLGTSWWWSLSGF